jgi:membrane protease YdiL (CAAX protease family)
MWEVARLRSDAVIAVAAVGLLSAAMLAPLRVGPWALPALLALVLWAIPRRKLAAIHVSLFALVWTATAVFFPGSRVWPTKLLAPLAVYAFAAALSAPLRETVGWLRPGRFRPQVWRWIVATVIVSSAALVAWVKLTHPDLSVHLANIPDVPRWTYPLAALLFAAFNAAIEELAFRGIVMGSLDQTVGENRWTIGIQAVCFAAAHYVDGFPNGWTHWPARSAPLRTRFCCVLSMLDS